MFDDLDLEANTVLVTLGMWAIVCVMIWKMNFMSPSGYVFQRSVVTVLMLPIIYLVVVWQKNKV